MIHAELNNLLARFEVREPIRSTFHPRFHIMGGTLNPIERRHPMDDHGFYVRLTCMAPDADGKRGMIEVHLDDYLDHAMPARLVPEFLRRMLLRLMQHEVDEAIAFDGQRIFDPHRERKPYDVS